MREPPASSPSSARDTALHLLMLGAVYALAVFFVVFFSPSTAQVASSPIGEISRVASASETPAR